MTILLRNGYKFIDDIKESTQDYETISEPEQDIQVNNIYNVGRKEKDY